MAGDIDETDKMLEEFDSLCDKYSSSDIDVERLLKGIKDTVQNYCG